MKPYYFADETQFVFVCLIVFEFVNRALRVKGGLAGNDYILPCRGGQPGTSVKETAACEIVIVHGQQYRRNKIRAEVDMELVRRVILPA